MIELNLKNKSKQLEVNSNRRNVTHKVTQLQPAVLPYLISKFCILPTVRKLTKFSMILVFKVFLEFVWK
jgi:hypothetical protein